MRINAGTTSVEIDIQYRESKFNWQLFSKNYDITLFVYVPIIKT